MNENYQCDFCGYTVSLKSLLVSHLDNHRKLPTCKVCGKRYKSLNNLKYHLKLHFDENYFIVCYLCGKPVSKWKLKRHIERHEPKDKVTKNAKNFSCRFCGLHFTKINNRTSHEKRIHRTKSNFGLENFKCTDCSSIFLTKELLRKHSFQHFSGKIHFCNFPGCKRYFKKGKLVTVHKRCHFEPQFKCVDCGAVFVQKSSLSKHQKERCPVKKPAAQKSNEEIEKIANIAKQQLIELKGRITQKPKCEKLILKVEQNPHDKLETELKKVDIKEEILEDWQYEFLDDAMLDMNTHDSSLVFAEGINISNDIICEATPNDCSEPKRIVKKIIAKSERPKTHFICDICGKNDISSKYALQRHLERHRTKDRPKKTFTCSVDHCKDTFTKKSLLLLHKKSCRTLDRKKMSDPFICDFCGKQYFARSSIVTHFLVTHKTVADFKCTQCCRKFKSHGNLVRHTRALHSDDKRFGCEKCGAMFKEKYQLEIHVHNHDEPTRCSLCHKMVSNIKVHLRHHSAKANNTIVKCPMCDKMIGKYQLVRHIKSVHEKQYQSDSSKLSLKIYTCKDCGDFFSRRQELRQHEYIMHSQSKLFECNICGTYFKKLKLLNVHRFSHQPLNVTCEVCNKNYARKGALWKHQKKNHPELIVNKKIQEAST